MDAGFDQEKTNIEAKFATPKLVKNERLGQVYSVGIGLPKETYMKEIETFFPPKQPHIFTADKFELIKEGDKLPDEHVVDAKDVIVLYMHGIVKNGNWIPEDPSLQEKGITIEDIVSDYESKGGTAVDVLFVCSNENNSMVKVVPFAVRGQYERPKIFMKEKPARGNVMFDRNTGEIKVQMRVQSLEDVECERWKNNRWGRVKVL